MRYNITKKVLIFWCLFISITAFYGGLSMLIDPSGKLLEMDNMLKYFSVLPFNDYLFNNYIFSGICLIIFNGIPYIICIYYLFKNNIVGSILGIIQGIILMLWITIQFIILPTNILSITYFILGFIVLITSYMTYVFYKQEHFIFNKNNYKSIGETHSKLVIYYSRMGYTKMIAYEIANKNKCDILELTTIMDMKGTKGFWLCGRSSLLKRGLPINKININLKDYHDIIIVSPVWVMDICSPIREFINIYINDLNNVSLVITHYMKYNFNYISYNVSKLLNKDIIDFKSIEVKLGVVKE